MMGFEHPTSFAWAVLAALVAALYLWRFPYRQQPVATFSLWQRALARRPAWFTLRFWISLAVQIVLVLLIVTALTEPFFRQVVASRRWMVLVLDVSASMAATDQSPSRFEQMQDQARQMIGNLRRGEQMVILSAGSIIRPIGRWGASSESLLAAVDALEPTDGPARITDAIAVAQDLLRDRPYAYLVVLSDGTFPEADAVGRMHGVRLVTVGGDSRNAAITGLDAHPQRADPNRWDVLVEIANRGNAPIASELHVGLADALPETVSLTLDRGQTIRHRTTVSAPQGGLLQARLTADDHLAADNLAQLRLHPVASPRVRWIASDDQVARALHQALQTITPIQLDGGPQMPERFDPETIYMIHRLVPQNIPPGPLLLIDPESSSDLWDHDGYVTGTDGTVVSVDPLARPIAGVDWKHVVFERMSRLRFHVPSRTMAVAASGDPLISALDRPAGKVLVLHASPLREHSDLILRADFARWLQQTVRWLADDDDPAEACQDIVADRAGRVWRAECWDRAAAGTTGDVIRLEAGQTMQRLDESAPPLQVFEGPLVALDRVGKWRATRGDTSPELADDDRERSFVPVNLLDSEASNLVRAEALTPDSLPLADPVRDQPLWMLLAGLALVLLTVEWCLYHRRFLV
ncbi:MAG: VWA domain-containing protein [Planctomycetaceae bacterium]|nr:MAG: VWA domain-containing protein [Planctomycetaceae bacterium]